MKHGLISLLACYQTIPELYARQVLGVRWWRRQAEVAAALVRHRRVMVTAAHGVGKTYLAAGLVNWFFDCYAPSLTLTTAPTLAQVVDLLWKEVRVQRGGRPGLLPKAPRMQRAPNHFAAGYTARSNSAFQGRHEERVLIIFDEAVGIDGPFWDAAEGMVTGPECYFLAVMNPTDTASRAYEETLRGTWHQIGISALEHPNITAELAGQPPPFPAAVRLAWVEERVQRWCTPVPAQDRRAGDLEWPPGSGAWHRPGPLAESRLLGRWPAAGTVSVWSSALWQAALEPRPLPQEPLELGCDVARFGDDWTSIVARRGPCVLHHETHQGWSTDQTAGQLKRVAAELAQAGEDPQKAAIKIDDDGVGGGVTDQAQGWNFVPISGAGRALQPEDYPNRRSELWFALASRAEAGELDLSRLSLDSQALLRRQVMAPAWRMDAQGRRVVEPKSGTKARIGRSPDDADALNLAFTPGPWWKNRELLEYLKSR